MGETVKLGEITCPSGQLVLIDGGYLSMWSGDRPPSEIDPEDFGVDSPELAAEIRDSVDFEVVGPDAQAAARSFDRQPGRYLYDIPGSKTAEFTAMFADHCRAAGLEARLSGYPESVPHRERARRCVTERLAGFQLFGVPAAAVAVPADRALTVEAVAGDAYDWSEFTLRLSDARPTETVHIGYIGVDWARIAFADADALAGWQHDESIDGQADFLFWGRDAEQAATVHNAGKVDSPGDSGAFGWTDLPIAEAAERGQAVVDWRAEHPDLKLAVDWRPHSHHWQVMRQVRANANGAGTLELRGARLLFAMTGCGDGYFPVEVDHDSSGELVAVHIRLDE